MTTANALIVRNNDVSELWAEVFRRSLKPKRVLFAPLVAILDMPDTTVLENSLIRDALDLALAARDNKKMGSVHTVANTIFPQSIWDRSADRQELYRRYGRIAEDDRVSKKNPYGTYFLRLIDHPDARCGPDGSSNQLEYLIDRHDRKLFAPSAYKLIVASPSKDHTGAALRGFPCLDFVTIGLIKGGQDLTITAQYSYQYVFERAYGNYLGLVRLGQFFAEETGRRLVRVTCVAAGASTNVSTRSVADLLSALP